MDYWISHDLIGDVDYNFGQYNVTFPAGATNLSLNIPINNDNLMEGNEKFCLVIHHATVTIGNPYRVTVIILDDDSKYDYIIFIVNN